MIVDLEAGFDAADDASALSSNARRDASITALAFCAARNCGGVAAVEEGAAACLEEMLQLNARVATRDSRHTRLMSHQKCPNKKKPKKLLDIGGI